MTEEKITEWINEVYSTVPLYINYAGEARREIRNTAAMPIIRKQDFVDAQDGCINPEYYIKYMRNELMTVQTSGSTGHYLQIMWDKSNYHCSMAELWLRRIKYHGIYPHNRLAYFFTDNDNTGSYISKENEFGIPKTRLMPEYIDNSYDHIMDWNPEWMLLQPSTAVLLTEYVRRKNKPVPASLRYIELSGEVLTDEVREMLKETFGCEVANQYGANEVNSVAYECPEGNMHVMTSNVYVEIVDDKNKLLCDSIKKGECEESGRIILTSLTNKAMPFIRYDIGDIGAISWKICPCGCKNPVLRLYGGRNNDFIFVDEHNRISPYVFVSIFDRINNFYDGAIVQFYIEQLRYELFEIKILADEELDKEEIIRSFRECLNTDFLIRAKYNIEFVKEPINTGVGGKYAYFRNRINKVG
ncbi:MAG: phenylacetate--CoA ligase family protein [Butyrivibrio sp.]|nr:phenylacetate--CoA ligase family protein [Butyrivibrio sp.]